MFSAPLKIFFYLFDFVGQQNACIGLGQALQQRGHQVFFVINSQFGDKFAKYGFDQLLLHESAECKATEQSDPDPLKTFCNNLIANNFFDNIPPIEKMKKMKQIKFLESIYWKNVHFEPQLKRHVEQQKPDFIVIDCDIVAPSLINAGIPWAFLFCSNPLGVLESDDLPPFTSGLPIDGDRKEWSDYAKTLNEVHFQEVIRYQRLLSEQFNYPIREGQKFIPLSPYLNIYQFPRELDYSDVICIPDNYFRVDALCREDEQHEQFELPKEMTDKMKPNDKLIYLSLGSMGSCDVALMRRLISILSRTPHWYIVSKGLLQDQFELADNMLGNVYLAQTQILPLVDLAISHGGNNTLTEAFTFAVPLIVLPLFYDQFDNAQRVQEKGYGVRIDTYNFKDEQLLNAIHDMLYSPEVHKKYAEASERIKNCKSKLKLCMKIEQIASKSK